MILGLDQRKVLLRGARVLVLLPDKGEERCPLRPGRSYRVQKDRRSKGIALAIVRSCERIELGTEPAGIVIERSQVLDRPARSVVWAAEIQVDREHKPIYLATQSDALYTTEFERSVKDEGEPLEGHELDLIAERGREKARERKRDTLGTLTQRVERLLAKQARGVDISRQLARVERAMEAAERHAERQATERAERHAERRAA